MADHIEIEGLAKFTRELKKLEVTLPKEMKRISKAGAEVVAVDARTKVPVRSGKLQQKIKSAATIKGAQVRVIGLPYAAPIHFGWRKHNIKPQPFIYEALDARRDEVIATFEKGLAALVDSGFTPGVN